MKFVSALLGLTLGVVAAEPDPNAIAIQAGAILVQHAASSGEIALKAPSFKNHKHPDQIVVPEGGSLEWPERSCGISSKTIHGQRQLLVAEFSTVSFLFR